MSPYQSLEQRFKRIRDLENALGILEWDHETMMPERAGPVRADALAALQVMKHEQLTDPQMSDWLDAAEAPESLAALGPWQSANLREMRRRWVHDTAVPADLVAAETRAASTCELAWRSARRDDDFAALLPSLTEVLRLQQEIAQAKAEALGLSPYDSLLDSYEPGGRAERVDALFDDLAGFLPPFLEAVLEKQARGPALLPLEGPFPIEAQRQLGLALMQGAGFDFDRGRLDVSAHPFCGGADDDVRLTTRYDEADFSSCTMAVLHETGHALYEQGRPRDWMAQPVGDSRSMAMHESQSLIIEMQAGRSREFLQYLVPKMREAFNGSGPAWTGDNLRRVYTRVARGLIRVDADEVTYPAHVILRYRLERAMLAGDLALTDLPGAWNDGMEALVGVRPSTDREGCLQDIHWPGGAWGYFPTYTLGAMTAAQLFDTARREVPELLDGLSQGTFAPLVSWLRRTVHEKGSLLSADALLTEATGRPLDAAVFKAHLRARYLDSD